MMKRIGLVVASLAAVAVIFAGASSFACGDDCKGHKTASAASVEAKSCCPTGSKATNAQMAEGKSCASTSNVQMASDAKAAGNGCGTKTAGAHGSCSTKNTMAEGHGSCSSKAKMASGKTCGTAAGGQHGCGTKSQASKAAYAANVYSVKDGHKYAVANGKTFEVTSDTPYYEVGAARYYFADKESMTACAQTMSDMAAAIEREAASLATSEANVVADSYGKKYGTCPVTNDKFLVTAGTPAKVMDGQKYYVCSDKCAHDLVQTSIHAGHPNVN